MEMDDNKLKRLLQEGMEWEADCIMAEVNSDPNVKDLVAPEEIHDKLMQQIREHEQEKEKERENQAKEEEELIRLGKLYKKKRARRKYIVLIAAVVCALGVGTISFGDGKKVIQEVKDMIAGKTQTNIDDSRNRTGETKKVDEEEVYKKIDKEFGFYPVQMSYLPDGIEFVDFVMEEDLQYIQLYYTDENEKSISYRIATNYRTGSIGVDIEDKFIQEYDKEHNNVNLNVKEYEVEENHTKRWVIGFIYKDAQYSLLITGMGEEEVKKITENLYFF